MAAELAIVALDVDGTLYDGHGVDPAAIDAIRAAAVDGHVFVIVTGRPWRDLVRIIPDVLPYTTVAVCEHGALLVDVATGTALQLVEPVAASVSDWIASRDGDDMVVYDATIGLPASARAIAEAACERDGRCYVVGNKESIAIVPFGCDKGTGLAHAVERLALPPRRIIAIGDATNDEPMFACADVAVAVANAEPALAESGIEVVSRPFGAGVAEALERHLVVGAG